MTLPVTIPDCEDLVCAWLKTTSVNALVAGKIFLAAKGNPLPRVEMYQVGGGPLVSQVPAEEARISFDCWSNNRPQAKAITLALINEIESLDLLVDVVISGARIAAARVLSKVWRPDPVSDTSRYNVDARFVVIGVDS